MIRHHRRSLSGAALAGLVALALSSGAATPRVAAAPTMTPTSANFGDVAISARGAKAGFVITAAPGVDATTVISSALSGPDAGDFQSDASTNWFVPPSGGASGPVCHRDTQLGRFNPPPSLPTNQCTVTAEFIPRSAGVKHAILTVTDSRGGSVSASLTGRGIPGCTYSVVHCNYAALYSGSVVWEVTLTAPKFSRVEKVTVQVVRGVATCNGAVTQTDVGGTQKGSITGTGMIAVEFDEDSDVGKYYLVTAACPSEAGMGSPVTAAKLDGREYTSDKQKSALTPGSDLKGATSNDRDTDAVNGAVGRVNVGWDLKRP
jgi:hypothetical protein